MKPKLTYVGNIYRVRYLKIQIRGATIIDYQNLSNKETLSSHHPITNVKGMAFYKKRLGPLCRLPPTLCLGTDLKKKCFAHIFSEAEMDKKVLASIFFMKKAKEKYFVGTSFSLIVPNHFSNSLSKEL